MSDTLKLVEAANNLRDQIALTGIGLILALMFMAGVLLLRDFRN